MSIWGLEGFDKQAGLTYLERIEDLEPVRESLETLAEAEPSALVSDDMLREALVAAEAVATMHQLPPADQPEKAAREIGTLDWDEVTEADAVLAHNAIARLRTRSELAEIWQERDATLWFGAIDDLLARLETVATTE